MASNLYKVGDWVYCETSPNQPYVIRKIEELTKTACGNVEAKVICAFRRQDIPQSIMNTIDKYQIKSKAEQEKLEGKQQENGKSSSDNESKSSDEPSSTTTPTTTIETKKVDINNKTEPNNNNNNTTPTPGTTGVTGLRSTGVSACDYEESEVSELNDLQRYNVKHRELYFSKYTDTIAATTIRAKCSVLLFNEEVERYADYLNTNDSFFYHLTYDPYQKSIVADKGEIRVGSKYQAEVPIQKFNEKGELLPDVDAEKIDEDKIITERVLRPRIQMNANDEPEFPLCQRDDLEIMEWAPNDGKDYFGHRNPLTEADIDKFMLIARSVGTFSRALDCNNSFKQPSLPLSAAAASRDITLFHAMTTLHHHHYDVGKAALSLITDSGPIICKDEMEDWSASEANLFSDGLEKYGKDFHEIRKEFLPWKSYKSLIEYYYSWKTTDRYVQQQRLKVLEKESKLKQVYIPNHSKQNQMAQIKQFHNQLFQQYDIHLRSCESCGTPQATNNQWYIYNPNSLSQLIMAGNTNAQALSSAAQTVHLNNTQPNGVYQSRMCGDCWHYWKKFGSFKFPNARQERLNQLKNQVHKCSVNGCGREFKMKQLLVKHCGVAHGYFAKVNTPAAGAVGTNGRPPPMARNRTSFYLLTTPMSQAARIVCVDTVKLKKLARKPFKLVELAELNKEWSKVSNRNIQQILDDNNKKIFKKPKLDSDRILVISKNRAQLLKKDADDDDNDDNDDLVIDQQQDKPDFLKYFDEKCKEPCYTPESLLFPKLDAEQLDKFHNNLMSQNRKRSHEQTLAAGNKSSTMENGAKTTTDSPPVKRFNSNDKQQQPRMPSKSIKPSRLLNNTTAPEDIYYTCNTTLKNIRQDIEKVTLRHLARRPHNTMDTKYNELYEKISVIELKSKEKIKQAKEQSDAKKDETTTTLNGDNNNKTTTNGNGIHTNGEADDITPMETDTTTAENIKKKANNETNNNSTPATTVE